MSEPTVRSAVGQKTLPDYLRRAAYVVYAIAAVVYLVGLYFDATGVIFLIEVFYLIPTPDGVVIPLFTLHRDPANSGLFVLATLLLISGYVTSKIGRYIEESRIEEVDQTQEWTVDIGNDE